jgi:hypothetical protein
MLQTMIREWKRDTVLHLKVLCPVHGCSAEMELLVTNGDTESHAATVARGMLLNAREKHLLQAHPKN